MMGNNEIKKIIIENFVYEFTKGINQESPCPTLEELVEYIREKTEDAYSTPDKLKSTVESMGLYWYDGNP